MLKIGDFSRLSGVPIKTLRYYDEVGLLAPADIDRFTGYRYYSATQLPRLNRLLALKELGFSLDQIGQVLNEGVTLDHLRGMLRLKQAEAQQRVTDEQERLVRIEARLRQIELEAKMSNYEVIIKPVATQRVVAIRDHIPAYSQQSGLWGELFGYIGQQRLVPEGACLTVYYDEGYKEQDVEVEVCQPLQAGTLTTGRVRIYDLPGTPTMASTIHHGPFSNINDAYTALIQWVQANGHRIVGPGRELVLHPPSEAGRQDDPNTVVEIQFPVEKV